MSEIPPNPDLVACCGLYCGTCKAYLSSKCKGCRENAKAAWCRVRTCCTENGFLTCASCSAHANPNDCKKFNNMISRLFGFFFKSDSAACIAQIKRCGVDGHAKIMAENKTPTIKRK